MQSQAKLKEIKAKILQQLQREHPNAKILQQLQREHPNAASALKRLEVTPGQTG